MQIRQELLPYLHGERFSGGLEARFELGSDDRILRSRVAWLEHLCRNGVVRKRTLLKNA